MTLAVFLCSRAAKVFADANPPDCCRTDLDEGGISREAAAHDSPVAAGRSVGNPDQERSILQARLN
jgi:hypothetical protein